MIERLTLVETGETLIKDGFNKKDTGNYTSICYGCTDISRCVNKCGFYKAFKKLAEYEDTGLEPWEVDKFNYSEQWQTRILLKKIAELEIEIKTLKDTDMSIKPIEDISKCIECGWQSPDNCKACRAERGN